MWDRGGYPELVAAIKENPIYQQLDVVREGRVLYLDDPLELTPATRWATVLSLPFVLDMLVPPAHRRRRRRPGHHHSRRRMTLLLDRSRSLAPDVHDDTTGPEFIVGDVAAGLLVTAGYGGGGGDQASRDDTAVRPPETLVFTHEAGETVVPVRPEQVVVLSDINLLRPLLELGFDDPDQLPGSLGVGPKSSQ